MNRFLMLVGVAVVAAAMYVAASPASQQASPSKQIKALSKKLTSVSNELKTVKAEADAAAGFIANCFVSKGAGVLPVDQFGDPKGTFGYMYDDDGTGPNPPKFVTALDVTSSKTPLAYLQAVDPTCVAPAALRHRLAHELPLSAKHSH